jgi:hypothetical protein
VVLRFVAFGITTIVMPRHEAISVLRNEYKRTLKTAGQEISKRDLQDICNAINEGTKWNQRLDSSAHQRLLHMVKAWIDLRRNWNDQVEEWKRKWKRARRENPTIPTPPTPNRMMRLDEVTKAFRFHIAPSPDGQAHIAWYPIGDQALSYFGRLILNPQCGKLSGPCLKCEKYYLKKTSAKSVFCSRKCSGGAVQTRRRTRLHEKRLSDIRLAIRNYQTRPRRHAKLNCTEYILQAVPGITRKFLTRAVHRGELAPLR